MLTQYKRERIYLSCSASLGQNIGAIVKHVGVVCFYVDKGHTSLMLGVTGTQR